MSVPVSKRTLSDMEFYHNAMNLRLSVTNLLLRDFGVKDKIRNLQVLSGMKKMSPEDTQILEEIKDKYGIKRSVIEQYPAWLINHFRENVLGLLRNLIYNIRAANSIYPVIEREYIERRMFQT